MEFKRDRSNIIQLIPSNNDNACKPPPPPTKLSDPPPISEEEQLRNEVATNLSIAAHDLKNLKFQLLRLAKIMKRKKKLREKQGG